MVIGLVVVSTAIWIFFDAKKIGVKRGQVKGLGNMGPWGGVLTVNRKIFWVQALPGAVALALVLLY